MQRVNTLELLLDKNDIELRTILTNNSNVREEEIRRLIRAMLNLKRCRQSIKIGEKEPIDLYWDSWDRHSHIHHRSGASPRLHRSTVNRQQQQQQQQHHQTNPHHRLNTTNDIVHSPIELSPPESGESYAANNKRRNTISPEEISVTTLTPSPSPPNSPSSAMLNKQQQQQQKAGGGKGFPTTPPPKKKHQTLLNHQQQIGASATSVQSTTTTTTNTTNNQLGGTLTAGSGGGGHQQNISSTATDQNSLTKSKSHESQLLVTQQQQSDNNGSINSTTTNTTSYTSNSLLADGGATGTGSASMTTTGNHTTIITTTHAPTPRTRLHTEPSPENYNDIVENSNNLTVPRSPCTPIVTRGMGHMISHRFTKKFKVMSTCDLCNKQMFFGLKCKECKYRCHKDCESNVPPSCGLPPEFVDVFKQTLQSDVFISNSSPNMGRTPNYLLTSGRRHRTQAYNNIQYVHHSGCSGGGADSSSAGSSCNSSTPSSPALLTMPPQTPAASKHTQFKFPEVTTVHKPESSISSCNSTISTVGGLSGISSINDAKSSTSTLLSNKCERNTTSSTSSASTTTTMFLMNQQQQHSPRPIIIQSDLVATTISNDSEKTISLSGSTSASTDSDRTPIRVDSTEEHDERDDRESVHWPRQNSVSLKEWDIPYDDLEIMEKIGDGRFGTVHRAQWHGAVAVKLLKEDYLDNEAFKLEVATFKKTRHENVVLFMGACIKPQAIVTALCKGNTLYTHIHTRKDKFNLNKTTMVAQQISQGMGYLHARGIVHKDLKTKNIFLENGKVIITDFGLFSATKLYYRNGKGLGVPSGWLCYLAPELMQLLMPFRPEKDQLPFSKASDIHAFGTVWYELLCGEFPFKMQPPEAIIFQVGRGMKQTLANLQATRDVKDILMMCWAYEPGNRPDFAKLLTLLERLPKKRLARSPSHPVQLSRSAESVF